MTYQNRHRQYSPPQSRFMQRDPLEAESGTINWFAYAENNPGSRLDQDGLRTRPPSRWQVAQDPPHTGGSWFSYCKGPRYSSNCSGQGSVSSVCRSAVRTACEQRIDSIPGVSFLFRNCMRSRCGCRGALNPDVVRSWVTCAHDGFPCSICCILSPGALGCSCGDPTVFCCYNNPAPGHSARCCPYIILHEMAHSCFGGALNEPLANQVATHMVGGLNPGDCQRELGVN